QLPREHLLCYGGEQVVDENGNHVYSGSAPFQYVAGQPHISNRRQQAYGLVTNTATGVALDATNFTPPTANLSSITSATTLDVGVPTAGYPLTETDQVITTVSAPT